MSTTHAIVFGFTLLSLTSLVGCADPTDSSDSEPVDQAASALTEENAMIPNAMIPNAMIPNAMIPNAMIPNALTPGAIDPGALSSLVDAGEAGALSRMFLRYVIGCAFDDTQSFGFEWTDAMGVTHREVYRGALGIAPQWASGPLDPAGQQLVSACVAARTNFYGVPVLISLRSGQQPLSRPSSAELGGYPLVEGAFWGNLFAPSPRLRACYVGRDAANSRAWERDCAAGHLDGHGGTQSCGIIEILGDCADLCDPLDPAGQFFGTCRDPELGPTATVVTTALPIAVVTP
jgi:hypothetical protein